MGNQQETTKTRVHETEVERNEQADQMDPRSGERKIVERQTDRSERSTQSEDAPAAK